MSDEAILVRTFVDPAERAHPIGVRSWPDRGVPIPETIRPVGRGAFMVAGRRIKLPARMP